MAFVTYPISAPVEGTTDAALAASTSAARDLKLDAAGDLLLTGGDLVMVTGIDAIAQHLSMRLRMNRGEWFLDTALGVPLFDEVLVKNPNMGVIESIYRDIILETPGVLELKTISLEFDPATRSLEINFDVRTDLGRIVGAVQAGN
mgnify:CR=1 FL=1